MPLFGNVFTLEKSAAVALIAHTHFVKIEQKKYDRKKIEIKNIPCFMCLPQQKVYKRIGASLFVVGLRSLHWDFETQNQSKQMKAKVQKWSLFGVAHANYYYYYFYFISLNDSIYERPFFLFASELHSIFPVHDIKSRNLWTIYNNRSECFFFQFCCSTLLNFLFHQCCTTRCYLPCFFLFVRSLAFRLNRWTFCIHFTIHSFYSLRVCVCSMLHRSHRLFSLRFCS